MKRVILLIMILTSSAIAQIPFGDSIMPFGAYSSKWASESYFTSGRLDSMSALGFNQHLTSGFTEEKLEDFLDHDIFPNPLNTILYPPGDTTDIQTEYAHSTYFETHPEYDSSQYYVTKFNTATGGQSVYTDEAGYFKYRGNGDMLSNIAFKLTNKYVHLSRAQHEYSSILKLSIDTTGLNPDSVVGIFKIRNYTDGYYRFVDTIRVSDLPCDSVFDDIEYQLVNDYGDFAGIDYFTVDDNSNAYVAKGFNFAFETTGICTVYVDYFRVYDQYGAELIAGDKDVDIKLSVSRSAYKDNILSWFLFDTMRAPHYRPFVYINNLIKEAMQDSSWTYPVEGGSWINFGDCRRYREFIRMANPEMFWTYIYPIADSTEHTGYSPSGGPGFQTELNNYLMLPCDSVRAVIAHCDTSDDCTTDKWLYTPQVWYCDTEDCTSEPRRKPTRAEVRCLTYMGMCYHPINILYWKLDSGYSDRGNQGIFQADGTPREGLYDAVAYDINPYIKAIDSTYLPLTWVEAGYTTDTDHDPDISIIDSIKAYSNDPDSASPDLGWMHVGVFEDTLTDEKYFMLVNRACSKDEQGNEAGSITAIAEINRGMFNNAEKLFVIDLADSIYHAGGDTGYVAIPETTYTTLYTDSKLYFTTVLRAGEGRLFKIAEVPGYPPLTTSVPRVYQGEFFYDGTYTIDTSSTLSYKCPSLINFTRGDILKVRGTLRTSGCDIAGADSLMGLVRFACVGDSIWIGMRFLGADALGDLHYCRINNVNQYVPRIWVDSSSVVSLDHCCFNDGNTAVQVDHSAYLNAQNCSFKNSSNGIFNQSGDSVKVYGCTFEDLSLTGIVTNLGKLEVESSGFYDLPNYGIYVSKTYLEASDCDFSDIGYYGIYADSCVSTIEMCDFDKAGRYAIYINSGLAGSTDSTLIGLVNVNRSVLPMVDSSQYCIRVDNNNLVRIEGYQLAKYKQGGLYLNNSSAVVNGLTIQQMDNYGIYATGNSDARITGCTMDSTIIGLYCYYYSQPIVRSSNFVNLNTGVRIASVSGHTPDLGDSVLGYGNNDLRYCSSYYIYQTGYVYPLPLVKAEMNYFGPGGPNVNKFRGNIDYNPFRYTPPSAKAALVPELPLTYKLHSAYPNPFNPTVNISFSLAEPGYTSIVIYNILGQDVRFLVDEYKDAGEHTIVWDGKDSQGQQVATGVYFYRLVANDFVDSKKMLLLR